MKVSVSSLKFSFEILQAIVSIKKGAYLLKGRQRGKPKFCPFRLSMVLVYSLSYVITVFNIWWIFGDTFHMLILDKLLIIFLFEPPVAIDTRTY